MKEGNKVAIIGCGYVGEALARSLSSKGFLVTCTVKTVRNIDHLNPFCQKVYYTTGEEASNIRAIIQENDVIIVTLAAKNREDYRNTYLKTAETFRSLGKVPAGKHLIYTSSTSVYGHHSGKWVDEDSPLLGETENVKILIETENAYLSLTNMGWKVTIFRLAEIYGPKRTLRSKIESLEGRVLGGDGANYSNMIHQSDITGALEYALSHPLEGIYNLADDDHFLRKDLYRILAEKYHTKHVLFDPNIQKIRGDNKRISNRKIKSAGYAFTHPHRQF
ncbi:MAG: NAD-dependent epimerase/dehydratase family protein [Chlamydiota bacterium]